MSQADIKSSFTEKEKRRLEKVDRLDSNKKRKKLIMSAVTAILILFFVGGTVFGMFYVLQYEGTAPMPAEITEYSPLPEGKDEILSDFYRLLDKNNDYNGTKLDVSFSTQIDNDSLVISGENAESLIPLIEHIKAFAVSVFSEGYENEGYKGKYGDDFSSLTDFNIDSSTVETASEINEENENEAIYTFSFKGTDYKDVKNSNAYGLFGMSSAEKSISAFMQRLEDTVTVRDAELIYQFFNMYVSVDRGSDRINSIRQERLCHAVLPISFKGEWETFGDITLEFDILLTKSFSFTRVEFGFTSDVYFIEKGDTDEIKARVKNAEAVSDVRISFISSDESVLSIDEDNFYKGKKVSDKPCEVRGICEYNGVIYEDTCIFYVRVPVEKVKVSQKEASLSVGEKLCLSATVSPEKASLKDVYWFSSDEAIIKVNRESGEVKAIAEGNATAYCITVDGNFKSSCNITVSEKESENNG